MGLGQIWNAMLGMPDGSPCEGAEPSDKVTKDEIVNLFARELQRDTSIPLITEGDTASYSAPWVHRIWNS